MPILNLFLNNIRFVCQAESAIVDLEFDDEDDGLDFDFQKPVGNSVNKSALKIRVPGSDGFYPDPDTTFEKIRIRRKKNGSGTRSYLIFAQ